MISLSRIESRIFQPACAQCLLPVFPCSCGYPDGFFRCDCVCWKPQWPRDTQMRSVYTWGNRNSRAILFLPDDGPGFLCFENACPQTHLQGKDDDAMVRLARSLLLQIVPPLLAACPLKNDKCRNVVGGCAVDTNVTSGNSSCPLAFGPGCFSV